ncbi:MAG: alpha/beta hydrolase [Microcoleus sp. SIO2G3]|nr:alpha/beta hydrolase [Microcoleus sp. SIO2G3]
MVRTVEIRGVPHAYELTAPTQTNCVLVFVHGWLLSRRYWQPAIDQLASVYQCLAYDLRGFGDSQIRSPQSISAQAIDDGAVATAIASDYTPAAYAKDLIDLLHQLDISNAWLVGHSLGGSISLWAADLAPELVQGVICVNSGGGIYLKEEFERFRTAGQQLVQMRPRWLCALPLIDLVMTRLSVARPIARSWGRQRLLDLVNANLSHGRARL